MTDYAAAERIAELEARVARIEDERAIRELIARYGILGDICRDEDWVALFAEDGAMNVRLEGVERMPTLLAEFVQGHDRLREFVSNPEGHHRRDYYGKCMHAQGLNTVIRIDHDDAVANSYSFLLQSKPDGIALLNASNNQWRFRRTDGQWRIVERRCRSIGHADYVGNIDATTS